MNILSLLCSGSSSVVMNLIQEFSAKILCIGYGLLLHVVCMKCKKWSLCKPILMQYFSCYRLISSAPIPSLALHRLRCDSMKLLRMSKALPLPVSFSSGSCFPAR